MTGHRGSQLFGKQKDPLKLDWHNGLPMRRQCGGCSACCFAPEIDTPELRKPRGVACEHICKEGCGLFGDPARPPVCSVFACNWLRGDGTLDQRPDRMMAMPMIAADRQQCAIYLAPGLTPSTITKACRNYIRRWHRKRKTAVLVLHGERYETTTAIWPDGFTKEVPTVTRKGDDEPVYAYHGIER